MPVDTNLNISFTSTYSNNPPHQTLEVTNSQRQDQQGSDGTEVSSSQIGEPLQRDRDACAREIELSLATNSTTNTQQGVEHQALRAAIERGDIAAVEEAIVHVKNINAAGEQGESLLMFAAECGSASIVELLKSSGAQIRGLKDLANRSLRAAAFEGLQNKVSAWIAAGADPNTTNSNGATAMIIAAQKGYVDVVRVFKAAGARLDAVNSQGHNALSLAALQGHLPMVKDLIESGANLPKDKLESLQSALKNAIDAGRWNVAVALSVAGMVLLSTYKSDFFTTSINHFTRGSKGTQDAGLAALTHLSSEIHAVNQPQWTDRTARALKLIQAHLDCSLVSAGILGKREFAVALRAEGATLLDIFKPSTERALRDAARDQRVDDLRAWIAAGVDVNGVNADQVSALMYAVLVGNTACIHLLINAGADLELADKDGDTALIYAAKGGKVESAKILLDHGAAIAPRDKNGKQAKDWALLGNHFDVLDVLISRGVQLTAEEKTQLMDRMSALLPVPSYSPAMHFLRISQLALDQGWFHIAEALQPKNVFLSTI